MRILWTTVASAFLAATSAQAGEPGPVTLAQAPAGQTTLLARAEALDEAVVGRLLDEAFSAVGCTLPADLLSVFEIYLLDRAMTALGEPIGPEVAQQGYFALSFRSTTIHHPEARAVLIVARALEGRVEAAIDDGRLRLRRGLFVVEDCAAEGTLFALSPYAR